MGIIISLLKRNNNKINCRKYLSNTNFQKQRNEIFNSITDEEKEIYIEWVVRNRNGIKQTIPKSLFVNIVVSGYLDDVTECLKNGELYTPYGFNINELV